MPDTNDLELAHHLMAPLKPILHPSLCEQVTESIAEALREEREMAREDSNG